MCCLKIEIVGQVVIKLCAQDIEGAQISIGMVFEMIYLWLYVIMSALNHCSLMTPYSDIVKIGMINRLSHDRDRAYLVFLDVSNI